MAKHQKISKYHEHGCSEKIKTTDKKIKQNKAQCDLDRKTAKISALSSRNVNKYKFSTGKNVLPDLPEKAAALKRFENSQLRKELIAQIDIAKKQYQKLDDTDEFGEAINKKSTHKIVLEFFQILSW